MSATIKTAPTETTKSAKELRGQKLAAMRKRAGLGQTQLGDLLGADQPYISRLENGVNDVANIGTARSVLLASLLHLDIQDFLSQLGIGLQQKRSEQIETKMRFGGSIGGNQDEAKIGEWRFVSTAAWRATGQQYCIEHWSGDIATVQAGDMVYADPSNRELIDGKTYVVRLGDKKLRALRRLKKFGRSWVFVSDNPKTPALQKREVDVIAQVYWHEPKPRSM